MGIVDLPPLIKQFGTKCTMEAAGLEGLVVGVDVSVFLYEALMKSPSLEQYHTLPLVPVVGVCHSFDRMMDALACAGVSDVIFVFDGCDHPLKAETAAARRQARAESELRLRGLYSTKEPALYDEMVKERRKCAVPRSDVLHVLISHFQRKGWKYVMAPFEADAQLASMCRQALIQAVLSTDSDYYVLKVPLLILDFKLDGTNAANSTVVVVEYGTSYPMLLVTLFPNVAHLATDNTFVEFAVLLGCDYCARVRSRPAGRCPPAPGVW